MDAFDLDAGDEAIEYDDEPKDSDKSPEADTRELMEEHGRPPWGSLAGDRLRSRLRPSVEGGRVETFLRAVERAALLLVGGTSRLRPPDRTLSVVEEAAFTSEDFLRWLNTIRPAGEAEVMEVRLTVAAIAAETAKMYQARVEWWGGKGVECL